MRKPTLSDLFTKAIAIHGTQQKVATKCGISQAMVSMYLSGKVRSVNATNLAKIARCLGVKPVVLLAACRKSVPCVPQVINEL